MSQIRKLQGGKNIPKKYKFQLDSQDIYLTDDQLRQIDDEIANLPMEQSRFLGNATNAIKRGDQGGSRADNTWTLDLISGIDDRNMKRLEKMKPSLWESLVPTDSYYAKQAGYNLLNIIHRVANPRVVEQEKTSAKKKIDNSPITLDFNDGVLSKTAGENIAARNRINQIIEHIKAGDNSTYDTSLWTNLDTIKSILADNPNYVDDLWTRMGTTGYERTKNDVDFLRNFEIGFNDDSSDETKAKSDIQKQLESEFKDNPDLYKSIGDKFTKDEFGVWRLKPGEIFDIGLNLNPGQGIWFNDDFYKSHYGTDPRLAPLKGLTYYNGALYSQDDPVLAGILNSEGGYNDLMSKGQWREANDIILSDFTDLARMIPTKLDEDKYNKFLSNPNYRFSNITGAVKNLIDENGDVYELPVDNDIIQYVDLSNPVMVGPYKRYNYNYAALDKTGNTAKLISKFDEIPNASAKAFTSWYPRIVGSENPNYEGKYVINVKDNNGKETGYRFYVNPNDENDVYLHIPNLKARGVSESDDVKLPIKAAEILLRTKDNWLPKVVGDTTNQDRFGELISKLVLPKYRQAGFSWFPWNFNAYKELFRSDRTTLKKLGFEDDDLDNLLKSIHSAYSGSAEERRNSYVGSVPTLHKNGGKMQYISKLASGGVSGATNQVSDKGALVKVNKSSKNTKNAAPITHIGQADWHDADTMDLVALVGDLGSLAVAFVPGANTASAAIGAGSSFTRYAADLSRDKDWLTATSGLLLNLTMDAATLLPLAGGLAKDAKTIKAIKSALPTIIKAASVYGLGSAVVESANKIANNESWTTRDVANLINGLTAITGLARQGVGRGKRTVTTDKMTVPTKKTNKVDLKGKAIELTSDEVSTIAKLDKSKQGEAMDNLLWNKVKTASGNPNLTKEEALSAVDRSQFDKDKLNLKFWKKGFLRHDTDFRLGDTKTTTYNKSDKRANYNNAIIHGHPKSVQLPPKVPTKSDVRISTGKAMDSNGYVYPLNEAPTGSTPIYRTYRNRTIKPEDQQLVPYTNNKTTDYRTPIAVPQLFNPFYFKNDYEHNPLPQYDKKGGVIKAQNGLTFGIPPQFSVNAFDKTTANTIAYRPELDWGTYVNGVYTPLGDVSPAPILYTTKEQYYNSARNAIAEIFDKPDLTNYGYKPVNEIEVEEDNLPTNTTSSAQIATKSDSKRTIYPNLSSPTRAYMHLDKNFSNPTGTNTSPPDGILRESSLSNLSEQRPRGGGSTSAISDKTRWVIPAVSAAGIISNLIQSKKYADEEKAKINDGRYSLQSQPMHFMPYYNPVFERQRQLINQRRMSGLTGIATNDWIQYNAGLNQLQSQLNAQESELITQEAQDRFNRDQTNVELMNQKLGLDTNTANENRRLSAYFNMASHDPELARRMRNWQTLENGRLQFLNMASSDLNTVRSLNQQRFNMQQSAEFDKWLRQNYAAEVEAYNKLSYQEKMNYAGLQDYIERVNPSAARAIEIYQQNKNEEYLNWLYTNSGNFNWNRLRGRTSPIDTRTYKKGGYVRGSTRYTKEPDEQIWIDNNKAAHNAVAKLSESTIKMLLKALK